MATVDECEKALVGLAQRLASVDPELRRRHSLDRSLSCTVTDLDVIFSGNLTDGSLDHISRTPLPAAQIRLTVRSDDLVALTAGSLSFPVAWASGRLKIDASMMDLLRLRSML